MRHLPRGEMEENKTEGEICCCQNCLCFPFFSVPSGFFPCAHYKLTFFAFLGSECHFLKADALQPSFTPSKRQGVSVSCSWSFCGAPECQAWAPSAEAVESVVYVSVSCQEPLLPLSRAFVFIFIKPDSKALISHVHLKQKMENINVSLSSCLKVKPFKEMGLHQG